MLGHWTTNQLQILHKAVTLVDYQSLFSYYGYPFGEVDGGCWMVAKAIQQVAGGQLHCVELNASAAMFGSFTHAVVKLGENAFIDGRGLHTTEQLLAQWSYLENTNNSFLGIQPLFFFPDHLERNAEVVEAIARTIHQLIELEEIPHREERLRKLLESDAQVEIEPDLQAEERFRQLLNRDLQIEDVRSSGLNRATG